MGWAQQNKDKIGKGALILLIAISIYYAIYFGRRFYIKMTLVKWLSYQYNKSRIFFEPTMDYTYHQADVDTFIPKLTAISDRLKIPVKALLAVMYEESRLNPQARNPISGAVGLIQFMPKTAKELGTSLDALLAMNGTQQLDYVEKYLSQFNIVTNTDVFLAVFFPAAIPESDDYILTFGNEASKAVIAEENPAISQGKKYITKADCAKYFNRYL